MKKELPIPVFDDASLFTLHQKTLEWELLKTAIELNLFDYLTYPVSALQVSKDLDLHPANTEHVLNALVALGCLTKNRGIYRNTPQTDTFFTSGKDTSLGQSLLFMEEWLVPMLNGGLKKLLIEGPMPAKSLADPARWEKGARASKNHSRCGRAQQVAHYVETLPEFPSFKKILDMGAGSGLIGIAVALAHPDLCCVLTEQPEVCTVAEETVAEYGMQGRVSVQPGDYMKDDFGTGYDLIMANFTLNFYRDRLVEIMEKVLESLKPGGIFLVTSDGLSPDKTSPSDMVINWLPMMLGGNDLSLGAGTMARSMLDAGFVSTQQTVLTDDNLAAHGPVEMTIGRKSL